jgi:hypothetical protein
MNGPTCHSERTERKRQTLSKTLPLTWKMSQIYIWWIFRTHWSPRGPKLSGYMPGSVALYIGYSHVLPLSRDSITEWGGSHLRLRRASFHELIYQLFEEEIYFSENMMLKRINFSEVNLINVFVLWEKYILVPQITTFWFFGSIRPFMPLILNRIPKIPFLHFEIITVKGGVFSDFWLISVRINGINRRMGPKNQKVVVWGVRVQVLVVRGAIRRKGDSLGG